MIKSLVLIDVLMCACVEKTVDIVNKSMNILIKMRF